MKLNILLQARKALMQRAQEKISTALSYKMMKFMKASADEDAFYNTKFKEIITKYAEKDENGNPVEQNGGIKIIKDKIEDCQKEINAIGETEIEKPKITFTVWELEELKLSMAEVFALDEFIEGEEKV